MELQIVEGGIFQIEEPDWAYQLSGDQEAIEAAKKHWMVIVGEMTRAETVCAVNAHAIMRLIVGYLIYERASIAVNRDGPLTKAGRKNPNLMVLRAVTEDIWRGEAELCLTPRSRGKATKVRRPRKTTAEASPYLRPIEPSK